MWPLTYMSIITIELLKNCHTAMFFMCFDLLYYFVKKASFCYWIVLLCYIDIIFLLPLKTEIKGSLLFYSTNMSTNDNMWIIVLDLLVYTWYLEPPTCFILLTSLGLALPFWCKYLRENHCKNLLTIFSLQTTWEEREKLYIFLRVIIYTKKLVNSHWLRKECSSFVTRVQITNGFWLA